MDAGTSRRIPEGVLEARLTTSFVVSFLVISAVVLLLIVVSATNASFAAKSIGNEGIAVGRWTIS